MKLPTLFSAFLCATSLLAAPAPRSLALEGTLTNTTSEAEGKARLRLTIVGEKATATLKCEPPLTGSGKLEGSFRNGWLELAGKLDEGFALQLRGALNARDYRGTYVAGVSGSPVQYGKFQLAIDSTSASP